MLRVVSLLLATRRLSARDGAGGPSSYYQIWPNRAAIAIARHLNAGVRQIGSGLVLKGIKKSMVITL